jgi:hypothetical protein
MMSDQVCIYKLSLIFSVHVSTQFLIALYSLWINHVQNLLLCILFGQHIIFDKVQVYVELQMYNVILIHLLWYECLQSLQYFVCLGIQLMSTYWIN